jgi:hypothetical protein
MVRQLTLILASLGRLLLHLVVAWKRLAEAMSLTWEIIWRRIRNVIEEPRRRDSALRCIPVREKVYRRPDPLIYSQQYLMAQGLAVTWDNPDVQVTQGGALVDPHALTPNTDYVIVVRVWNGSTNAPAVHLPVRVSYMSFGIGTPQQIIGEDTVDLGVKGSATCPVFAKIPWRTPAVAAHFCLRVDLLWADDANPLNNMGQTNTDVKPLNSPTATFTFAARNDAREPRTLRFEPDGYRLPARPSCDDVGAPPATDDERRARIRRRHGREHHPVPEGWHVHLAPARVQLEPEGEQTVTVTVVAPTDDFRDLRPINVNVFADEEFLGGVTLYVKGAGSG